MCDNIYRREKYRSSLKLNTAAGQIPGSATFAWNTPGRDAKGSNRKDAPKVKQGRTQERGRRESGKSTLCHSPGNDFPKSTATVRRKVKVIITENSNYTNPSYPIPSETKPPSESSVFTKRIGSTNYRVSVHFSKTSRETMNDKILRLMKNEAARP